MKKVVLLPPLSCAYPLSRFCFVLWLATVLSLFEITAALVLVMLDSFCLTLTTAKPCALCAGVLDEVALNIEYKIWLHDVYE